MVLCVSEVLASQEAGASAGQITNKTDSATAVATRTQINKQLTQKRFGNTCRICHRLSSKTDLKLFVKGEHEEIFKRIIQVNR